MMVKDVILLSIIYEINIKALKVYEISEGLAYHLIWLADDIVL